MDSPETLVGKIVHGTYGYNCTRNDFCVVVGETPKTVLLSPHKTRWLEKTLQHLQGIPVQGEERPVLPEDDYSVLSNKQDTFRAKKRTDADGSVRLWGKGRSYQLWDGLPKYWNSA